MKLGDICKYRSEKTDLNSIKSDEYVSTDNMLPNFGGIGKLKSFPSTEKVSKFYKNDILLSNIRPYFKKMIIADKESGCSSDVLVIETISSEVISKYLYYRLRNNDFFDYVVLTSKGTKMPRGDKAAIMNFELDVPNLDVQKKIVKILETIDNKIKINSHINDNLHKLMKIKFNNYIDNIEEYEESVLSKIANYKNGLAMQKFRPIDEIGLPVVKIKEMNSGISPETERCKSDIEEEVIINDGDVLFAWSGTLCMSIWCEGKAGLNQHIFKVTSDKYPKWFYYLWTLKHLDNFIAIAAGKATTMGHIKRTELDKAIVKIPNDKSIKEMDKIFTPMLNKYINNSIETRNLIKLRDALLPKLINGEINLDKIDI